MKPQKNDEKGQEMKPFQNKGRNPRGKPVPFEKKPKKKNHLLEQLKTKKKQEKQERTQKFAQIEKKREERQAKRKERNAALCRLTAKGQPVMKHRINYLLKQIQETMGTSTSKKR